MEFNANSKRLNHSRTFFFSDAGIKELKLVLKAIIKIFKVKWYKMFRKRDIDVSGVSLSFRVRGVTSDEGGRSHCKP